MLTNITKNNFNIIEWIKYQKNNGEFIQIYKTKKINNRSRLLVYSDLNELTKYQKNNIINILNDTNSLEILSKPFDNSNNLFLINKVKSIYNNDNNNILYLDLINYYLNFSDSKIIENIHWSYFKLEYFFIFIEKINNLNKIIEIISKNYIYNTENFKKIFTIIFDSNIKNNFYNTKNIIILDYLSILGFSKSQTIKLTDLENKYNKTIDLINNKKLINFFDNKNNLSNIKLISELIINYKNDDKLYTKLLKKVNKHKLLQAFYYLLENKNISEKKTLQFLNLFDTDTESDINLKYKLTFRLTFNISLYCGLLSNGYVYCIKKIWKKSLPKYNHKIYNVLKKIIKEDNDIIFKVLLDENILYDYLYNNNKYYLWYGICFHTDKITKILVKYNYQIPKNVFFNLSLFMSNNLISYRQMRFNRTFKSPKNIQNLIKNLSLFEIPINSDLIELLYAYFPDEFIIDWMKKNLEKIYLDKIIGLTLLNKKFNLLENILKIDKNIFNEKIYLKNINIYLKYLKDPHIISQVYIYNITHFNQKISKKMISLALKYENYILLKIIFNKLLKQPIKSINLSIDFIKKKYINIDTKFNWRYRFFYNKNKNKTKSKSNKTFNLLKNNVKNWNLIYNDCQLSNKILKDKNILYENILEMYQFNNNFIIDFALLNKLNCNTSEKLDIILKTINNYNYFNMNKDDIDHKIFLLLNFLSKISLFEYTKCDNSNNNILSNTLKKYLTEKIIYEFISHELISINQIEFINKLGYFKPNIYTNTFIIIWYIDTYRKDIIKYYLSSYPFIKEKTYAYLSNYVDFYNEKCNNITKIKWSKKSKPYYMDNYLLFSKILSLIPKKNIIKESSLLYNYKSFSDNNIDYDNQYYSEDIKRKANWLYDDFKKTDHNDILSEI